MGENLVIVDGFLGRDAKCHEFGEPENRRLVANLNLATSKIVNDKKYTEWHRIVVFSKAGSKMANALQTMYKTGKAVLAKGELRTREWSEKCECGKEHRRFSTEIHITGFDGSRVRLLGSSPAKAPEAPAIEAMPPELEKAEAEAKADNPIQASKTEKKGKSKNK